MAEERVIGQVEQTQALVPVPGHSGEVVLPEIRVPWWDVVEDREKVAVLPARTLQLTGMSSSGAAQSQQGASATAEEALPLDSPGHESLEANWIWPLLTALFGLGWLTTMAAWWLQVRTQRQRQANGTQDNTSIREQEQASFTLVCHHARNL